MATQTTHKLAHATEARPEDIAPHPLNPRESATADEGLVASVREMGVLERLVLAPVPTDLPDHARRLLVPEAEFLLIAGHRRLHAALEAGLTLVPVDVRHDLDTTEKQLAAIAAENIHRSDLNAVEEGDLYLALGDLGLSQAQISERTSVARPRVSQRTRVAKLPQTIRQRLASQQMTLDAAEDFTKLGDDPAEVERIAAMPPYAWQGEVQRAVQARDRARQDARREKELADAGVSVLDDYPPTPGVEEGQDVGAWWRLDDLLDMAYDGIACATAEHMSIDVGPDEEDLEAAYEAIGSEDVEAWHQATCPGHAVVRVRMRDWQGEQTAWVAICTTPTEHDSLLTEDEQTAGASLTAPSSLYGQNPDSDEAEAEVEAPEVAARRAHLQQRAAQQTAWLAQLAQDPPSTITQQMWDRARARIVRLNLDDEGQLAHGWAEDDLRRRRHVLGLPDDHEATPAEVDDAYQALADSLTLQGLDLLYQAVHHGPAYVDEVMARPGWHSGGWMKDRVKLLASLGWLWDDVELEELRADPQLIELAGLTDDDAPAAAGDEDATEGEVA